jgi:hypothetical protein
MDAFTVPDRIGTVEAWRAWLLVSTGERPGLTLRSLVWATEWEPREPLEARCASVRAYPEIMREHESPGEQCDCGIYGLSEREAVVSYVRGRWDAPSYCTLLYRVVGRVAMWGKVVEGRNGVRAARAYPVEFQLPRRIAGLDLLSPEEATRALEPWGVPVTVTDETLAPSGG